PGLTPRPTSAHHTPSRPSGGRTRRLPASSDPQRWSRPHTRGQAPTAGATRLQLARPARPVRVGARGSCSRTRRCDRRIGNDPSEPAADPTSGDGGTVVAVTHIVVAFTRGPLVGIADRRDPPSDERATPAALVHDDMVERHVVEPPFLLPVVELRGHQANPRNGSFVRSSTAVRQIAMMIWLTSGTPACTA